ncbi:D-alanyl-D-alanine carboxypeptidase family protein [Desulfocastanea catecholica]
MKRIILVVCVVILCSGNVWAQRAKINDIARDPYISALVIEADSGQVLFEDNARTVVYPASVLKIMDMLVILDQIEQGKVRLDQMVQVTKEAAQMGGSQVYLDPKEQFSVEDLLYALAVQSANDAAVALAVHVAGSTEGFVALMNQKAEELGMKDSRFYSVHGLPPAKGQQPDQTTAYDLALLGRELAKRPAIFEYTNTRERPFRDGKFIMRNHNHLLGMVNGCDGFKTGYFQAAGFSVVATAQRDGVRIIAIVMGSKDRKIRDAKTSELLAKGFAQVPPKPVAAAVVEKPEPIPEKIAASTSPPPETAPAVEEKKETAASTGGGWGMFFGGLVVGIVLSGLLALFLSRQHARKHSSSRRYR